MYGSPASATIAYSPLYKTYGISSLAHATADDPSYITDQWWSWYLGEIGFYGFLCFIIMLIGLAKLNFILSTWSKSLKKESKLVLSMTSISLITYSLMIGMWGNTFAGPPQSYIIISLIGFSTSFAYRGIREGVYEKL